MQINAASGLEDVVQFNQPNSHHDEISHHVVSSKEGAQGLDEVGELARAAGDDFLVDRFNFDAPLSVSLRLSSKAVICACDSWPFGERNSTL